MRLIIVAVLAALTLSACNKTWAPVEDRSSSRSPTAAAAGSYTVRRGDSLHAIAFRYGMDWRDIARFNGISAPYVIHPGQVLRLTEAPARPPVTTTAAKTRPSISERAVDRPYEPPKSEPEVVQQSAPTTSGAKEPVPAPVKKAPAGAAVSTADPTRWLWPVEGRILSSFKAGDPARNGIEIAGREGQAITASAAGEVVYSGNGLIGYGELIIIKHSDRMLSAYAHNRKRLVAEGQAVAAGEKIAEMGRDDRNRAMLHFEIRRDGTPQDPMRFLPGR